LTAREYKEDHPPLKTTSFNCKADFSRNITCLRGPRIFIRQRRWLRADFRRLSLKESEDVKYRWTRLKDRLNRRRIDRSMKLKFLGSNFFGCGLRNLRRCASYDRIELEIGPGQASVVLKSPPPDSYPLCPSRLKGFLFSTRSWGKVKTCEFCVKTQIAPSSVRKSLI